MSSPDSRQVSLAPAAGDDDELYALLSELFGRAIATDRYENNEAIDTIFQAVQDGLLTPEEATDIVPGKMLWRKLCETRDSQRRSSGGRVPINML
jgi:hypothetical protein